MSSDDPVSSATEGFTSATIKLGIEGIKKLVDKFRNRKIAFVQDSTTIEKVKEDLRSNELKFYKSYIRNSDLIIPVLMGLTLRRLEEEKDLERLDKLRYRILSKYDAEGLHIAQAVQSNIISKYITYLIENYASEEIMKKKLISFLENIESHISFVKNDTDINKESNKILTKINANSPDVFVVSGMSGATENTIKIIEEIDKQNLNSYYKEDYSKENKRITFFHKVMTKS